MNKIILIFLLLVAINFVDAETTTYTTGQAFSLNRECFYEGDVCGDAYNCGVSVYDTDGALIVDNATMTNSDTYFNYSMAPLSTNGGYRVRMSCTDGTNSGSEIFYFNITNTGDTQGMWIFLALGIFSFVLLAVGLFMKNYPVLAVTGAMFVITGMYAMIYGLNLVNNLYTRSIAFVMLGLGIFFLIVSSMKMIDVKESDEF